MNNIKIFILLYLSFQLHLVYSKAQLQPRSPIQSINIYSSVSSVPFFYTLWDSNWDSSSFKMTFHVDSWPLVFIFSGAQLLHGYYAHPYIYVISSRRYEMSTMVRHCHILPSATHSPWYVLHYPSEFVPIIMGTTFCKFFFVFHPPLIPIKYIMCIYLYSTRTIWWYMVISQIQ